MLHPSSCFALRRSLSIALIVLVLLAGLTPVASGGSARAPERPVEQAECQCVGYVVNKLFGGPRPGVWDTAASMATDAYWGSKDVVGKKNLRTRSRDAKRGDVIIMQPYATVYAWNKKTEQMIELTNIGDGAGHIGLILSAEYDGDLGGWFIKMRSANWPGAWAVKTLTDGKCSNVADHWIFVPNGDPVSFWRKLPSGKA